MKRVIIVSRVTDRVFGDAAVAREWTRSPQPTLDGAIPNELVDTLEGLERALSELESLGENLAGRG